MGAEEEAEEEVVEPGGGQRFGDPRCLARFGPREGTDGERDRIASDIASLLECNFWDGLLKFGLAS